MKYFWSVEVFHSVVNLQLKWQAMRVQSPIISSLYTAVHVFHVWKAVGSWMWNAQNNSHYLVGVFTKCQSHLTGPSQTAGSTLSKEQAWRLGSSLTCIFQKKTKTSCFPISLLWQVNCVAFLYFSNIKQSNVTLGTRCNATLLWCASMGIWRPTSPDKRCCYPCS